MGHGVADRVELATLPRDAAQRGLASRLEACMIVADDEFDATEPAVDEGLQELAPVIFRLAEFHAASEDGPLAIWGDADRRKNGTRPHGAAMPHLFVPGITDQLPHLTQRAISPCGELLIEFGGRPADLGGRDLEPAELFDDGRDL